MPDGARIAARLEQLWRIRSGRGGGADRPAYSSAEAEAMLLVAGWARETGLSPAVDRHGNLWALPDDWSGPLVSAGSHVDTVPDGGRYDGALGTVLGLELAHDLLAAANRTTRPALLVCAAEEAPRFGAGTIGSRLLVGTLSGSDLHDLHDEAGRSAAQAQAEYLHALRELPALEPPMERLRAHAEIHVAQRRTLRELGVVRVVASPRRFEIELRGEAGHSGEISMEERRDALAAAADVVVAVEQAARAEPAETVATVATLALEPGALSVIPALVTLGLDMRGISSESLARLERAVRAAVSEIADRRGVGAEVRLLRTGEPVALDTGLASAALASAARLGIPATETWSGAGHDAQHLAALVPTMLLFVPLQGGESHTPSEGADAVDILNSALLAYEVLHAYGP